MYRLTFNGVNAKPVATMVLDVIISDAPCRVVTQHHGDLRWVRRMNRAVSSIVY